jgi:hypothetical protein
VSQVSITLVRADTNQEFDVELPDDAPISELLPALVKELGLPLTGPDGNQVAYELSNKRSGREYKEGDSLGSVGTKTGDSCLLTSTFVAGGTLKPDPECPQCGSIGGKPDCVCAQEEPDPDDVAGVLLRDIDRARSDRPVRPEAILYLLARTVQLIQLQGRDVGHALCDLTEQLDDVLADDGDDDEDSDPS